MRVLLGVCKLVKVYYSNYFELAELFLVLLQIVSIIPVVRWKDGNISLIFQYCELVENICVSYVEWYILVDHYAKNKLFHVIRYKL